MITVISVSRYRDSTQLKVDLTVIWFSIDRDLIQLCASQTLDFPSIPDGQLINMLFQNYKPTSLRFRDDAFFGRKGSDGRR